MTGKINFILACIVCGFKKFESIKKRKVKWFFEFSNYY